MSSDHDNKYSQDFVSIVISMTESSEDKYNWLTYEVIVKTVVCVSIESNSSFIFLTIDSRIEIDE